jgi:hypothetical protein
MLVRMKRMTAKKYLIGRTRLLVYC